MKGDSMEELDKIKKELIKAIASVYGPKEAEEHAYTVLVNAAGRIDENKRPWKDLPKILKEEINFYKNIHKKTPEINEKKNQKLVRLILELNPGDPKKALLELAEMLTLLEMKSRNKSTKFYRDILIDKLEKVSKKKRPS